MTDDDGSLPRVPEARSVGRKRTRLSLVWLIPIVAAAAGAWIAVTRILGEGPEISIVFQSAEGLEAGKTKVEYNGVEVGTITQIRLSDDHLKVISTVKMEPKTEDFLVADTQFWAVRPRISGATISGLGTLVSGVYIDTAIGESKESQRHFEALENPPVVLTDAPGRFFVLKTPSLGSLDDGTPIYFRHLKVGEIASYELQGDGQGFLVKAFVNAPYDQYVTPNTRFWQASGIDVSLSASGLDVQTESLLSILVGGVAFETDATAAVLPPAEANASFTLFENRAEAFRTAARNPETYVLVFEEEVRGLSPGAPVDFRGIQVGDVVDVTGQLDPASFDFSVHVTVRLDAGRFGVAIPEVEAGAERESRRKALIDALVSRGVRAQLKTGSLLTGALYIAFDFFPDAQPAQADWAQQPPQLPTLPGELAGIEASLASIMKKLDKLPIEAIGKDVKDAIVELDRTLASARELVENANTLIEPNSVLGEQLESTLEEVSGAARSFRVLADYLERHPEALIEGKTGEAK